MAANAGRVILGAVGAVATMELYNTSKNVINQLKSTVVEPTIVVKPTRGFIQAVMDIPTSVKIAIPALTVGSLAVIYALRRKRKEVLPPNIPVTTNVNKAEESIVQGSEMSDRPIPSCQGMIARKVKKGKEDVFEAVGCCVRTAYGIWVPAHVLGHDFENLYVLGKRMSRTMKDGGIEYYVPSIPLAPYYERIMDSNQFGAEMVNIVLTAGDYSSLGLTVAKMGNLAQKSLVTIVGPQGRSSMGDLTPGAILGSVKYTGSTMGGFSGAPYMCSSKVIGIHLHGGAGGNGGQEALYLNQMYKIENKIEDESVGAGMDTGAKVLSLAFRQKKDVKYEELDHYVVFRDDTGHYHRVMKETFYSQKEKYTNQDLDYDQDDYDSDEETRYGGDPDEWDRQWKKGKYAEQRRKALARGKRPLKERYPAVRDSVKYRPESKTEDSFLYQGSKKYRPDPNTRRAEKHAEKMQRSLERCMQFLEQYRNGQTQSQCPPPTQPQPGPSTASPSN